MPAPGAKHRVYAGIGSRSLLPGEAERITTLAAKLARRGFWLHSGNAAGADAAFQAGAAGQGTAFLPWEGHEPANLQGMEPCHEITDHARETARRLHRDGVALTGRRLAFMARNVQIVEGLDKICPVQMLLCCAAPSGPDAVSGGSALAWNLARERGIPRFNLRRPEDAAALDTWLTAAVGRPLPMVSSGA